MGDTNGKRTGQSHYKQKGRASYLTLENSISVLEFASLIHVWAKAVMRSSEFMLNMVTGALVSLALMLDASIAENGNIVSATLSR